MDISAAAFGHSSGNLPIHIWPSLNCISVLRCPGATYLAMAPLRPYVVSLAGGGRGRQRQVHGSKFACSGKQEDQKKSSRQCPPAVPKVGMCFCWPHVFVTEPHMQHAIMPVFLPCPRVCAMGRHKQELIFGHVLIQHRLKTPKLWRLCPGGYREGCLAVKRLVNMRFAEHV